MSHPRRIFGRVKVKIGDASWKFEMTKAGIEVRQKHQRYHPVVGFGEIVRLAKLQMELFNETTIIPLGQPAGNGQRAIAGTAKQQRVPVPVE